MSVHGGTRRYVAGLSLALMAGFVDGFGFVFLGGYFVSFMSGNTTQAGAELVQGSFGSAAFCAALIVCFVAGSAAGTATALTGVRPAGRVLALVAAALVIAALFAGAEALLPTGAALAFGMGAVNTVFSRDGVAAGGITYMTGALMKVGEGIVAALRGRDRTGWLRYLGMWAAIAAGAILGAAAMRLGTTALWAPAAATLIAAIVVLTRRRGA
ncbi:DUF1275 family protein [Microbacterium sp. NPDC089189]|uniref:YoaK family protein n=1 Tax=Microbacterium sp. NPDC089189 TaxID=3154972 RepID=UPI003445F3EF